MRGEERFSYINTSDIRLQRDITDPVEYLPEIAVQACATDVETGHSEEGEDGEEDQLLQLPVHELVDIIRKLRVELRKRKIAELLQRLHYRSCEQPRRCSSYSAAY